MRKKDCYEPRARTLGSTSCPTAARSRNPSLPCFASSCNDGKCQPLSPTRAKCQPFARTARLFAENRPSLLSVNELSEFHLASALNPPPNLMSFSWLVFL